MVKPWPHKFLINGRDRPARDNSNISHGKEGNVFEPMFQSLCFALFLRTWSRVGVNLPWGLSTAIVSWYYAVYHSIRAAVIINSPSTPEKHMPTANALTDSGLCHVLPHPLNMVATRVTRTDYTAVSLAYPGTSKYSIANPFSANRSRPRDALAIHAWYIGLLGRGTEKKTQGGAKIDEL